MHLFLTQTLLSLVLLNLNVFKNIETFFVSEFVGGFLELGVSVVDVAALPDHLLSVSLRVPFL